MQEVEEIPEEDTERQPLKIIDYNSLKMKVQKGFKKGLQ